ncbi:MAG: hypothetical protein KAR24_00210 [Candidatus Pacebacteria bacterium]|nr:hypothetical protein [Candidatus Paceibacterota bacterium]
MDILLLKKKIKYCCHRDRSKLYITPYREWTVILIGVFVSLVGVSVFGYHAFNKYYIHGADQVVSEGQTQEVLEVKALQSKLAETVVYFEKKEQEHAELLKEKRTFESILSTTTESSSMVPSEELSSDEISVNAIQYIEKVVTRMSNEASVWKALFVDLLK